MTKTASRMVFKLRNPNDIEISDYVDQYSGPEYIIYSKYAFVLKYFYLSIIFGSAFPVVFLISFAAMLN